MNYRVSTDFHLLKNMFLVRSQAHLMPYLCKFLSSFADIARMTAKHQFLFILFALNLYPNKFIPNWKYLSPDVVLCTELSFLQMYNFALYIQNLRIYIQQQNVVHNNNLHTWCMFLPAEVSQKLKDHIKLLFSSVYQARAKKYQKRIRWMLEKRKKTPRQREHHDVFKICTFPFFDKHQPPPSMLISINPEQNHMSSMHGHDDIQRYNTDRWFINLSQRKVTREEQEILKRGFKFAFRDPQVNGIEFYSPIEFILNKVNDPIEQNKLRTQFTNTIKKHVNQHSSKKFKKTCNLINGIKNDKEITIVNADKGNTLVMMDRNEYNSKMLDYLNDPCMFEKMSKDPTQCIIKTIKLTLKDLQSKQLISAQMYKECLPAPSSQAPNIFAQLKIHKPFRPLRPIINGKNNPTKNLSKFLVTVFNNFIPAFEFSLKNTKDFIDRIKQISIQDNSFLVSFDVINMYNSIPLNLVTDAIEFFFDKFNNSINIGKNTLISLTNLVTKNSYCRFQTQYYTQKHGLAMGSPLSPILANMTMSYVELTFLKFLNPRPCAWYRYVDDVFSIWNNSLDQLNDFLDIINSYNKNIQFTMEVQTEKLNFLDVTVTKSKPILKTNVFRKNTFSAKYLNYQSNHPRMVKLGIATNLFHRALTFTSDPKELHSENARIKNILTINGYPETVIDKARLHAKTIAPKQNSASSTISDKWITLNYIPILSETLAAQIRKLGYKVAYKPKNTLAQLYFKNPENKNIFEEKGVIYLIECECGAQYVGETGRKLIDRVKEHQRYSKPKYIHEQGLQYKSAIGHHVAITQHHIDWKNSVSILDKESTTHIRKIKESYFIKKLNPSLNIMPGLSFHDQWSWILDRSYRFKN